MLQGTHTTAQHSLGSRSCLRRLLMGQRPVSTERLGLTASTKYVRFFLTSVAHRMRELQYTSFRMLDDLH